MTDLRKGRLSTVSTAPTTTTKTDRFHGRFDQLRRTSVENSWSTRQMFDLSNVVPRLSQRPLTGRLDRRAVAARSSASPFPDVINPSWGTLVLPLPGRADMPTIHRLWARGGMMGRWYREQQ